jgi:gluconokinase
VRIVVMGVSGCGKSTLGAALAASRGVPYVEGDALHPPRNIERMRAGIALTDEDRQGWLQALAAVLRDAHGAGHGVVVSCSALKRRYRDTLRAGAPDVAFVHLHGTHAQLAQRLAARQGHYMPASLLQSQLEALEMPAADESAVTLDLGEPVDRLLVQATQWLERRLDT